MRAHCINTVAHSFGFGGANAHAILESYTPNQPIPVLNDPCFMPFVFSAASETSLTRYLDAMRGYLEKHGTKVAPRDLALTLHSRRSRHRFRTSIAAASIAQLSRRLEEKAEQPAGDSAPKSGVAIGKQRVLAVFTGQGAQSARMAATLIENSPHCSKLIGDLERRLATLPSADRPSWSLKEELLTHDSARISKAYLSQPLCTALQILHVDLLRAAGIDFAAVVGHSSGEIGAAYCAGMISAEDAICIAYYRGLRSTLAGGLEGQQGAMMAVGTSFADAQELCNEDDFHRRVSVAAINASTSVTLSGDDDAISEMKIIFEDEQKFTRHLKVDKAYHSSHMVPCSDRYFQDLQSLAIRAKGATTPWFSSVDEGKQMSGEDTLRVQSQYWVANMAQPVHFMQAVQSACKGQGPFDVILEIGPHIALKGPTLQNVHEVTGQKLPYVGTHIRGDDAVTCLANALGQLWTQSPNVNLRSFEQVMSGQASFTSITGLPPYCWDHAKEYWHESRHAKAIRTRSEPVHELLGHLSVDSTDRGMRWRNILSPKEIPWLKGHALQHQAVFPAAGYVVAAVEAVLAMAKSKGLSVALVEITDFDIQKALVFDTEDSRVEFINILTDCRHNDRFMEASFSCSGSSLMQDIPLSVHATGHAKVIFGQGNALSLPPRSLSEPNLSKVNSDDLYESLAALGYQYTGPFRALSKVQRKLGHATGLIDKVQTQLSIHPAVLDAAFQSLLVAQCAPNSGGIWSLHVPRGIKVIRVDPFLCAVDMMKESPIAFDCIQSPDAWSMKGDISLYPAEAGVQHAMVQVESLHCVSFSRPTAHEDKKLFATQAWDVANPDAKLVVRDYESVAGLQDIGSVLERMSVFFLRRLEAGVPQSHPSRREGAYQHYFEYASHILACVREKKLPLWRQQWESDSSDDIAAACQPYLHIPDVQLLNKVGESIVEIATGQKAAIEVTMQGGLLSNMYESGLGFQEHTTFLARLVKQIVHRYPRMNILEVGAGTGGATKKIFEEITYKFVSYTYTDISSGFFESAQGLFSQQSHKMSYRTLDIGQDVRRQGFDVYSYDLVVASAVLHASMFDSSSPLTCLTPFSSNPEEYASECAPPSETRRLPGCYGTPSFPCCTHGYNLRRPTWMVVRRV